MPRGPTRRIRGRAGKLRCVAAPESSRIKDLAAASDAVAEIHAGYYVVAGTAFKVVLLAVFGLDVNRPRRRRVARRYQGRRAAARCGPSVRFANL